MSHQELPHSLSHLLSANAQWAEDVKQVEPDFFRNLAKGQSPKVLWIGCADSRVPESVITGAKPGDLFVHRNIANQFHLHDDSALSVLAYAINDVGVEHVVIVGHTECGGAAASFAASKSEEVTQPKTPLERWLAPLIELATSLRLSTTPASEALPILVEENVKVQVDNVSKASTLVDAWAKNKQVWVHGWLYEIGEGKLKDLKVSRGPPQPR